MRVICQICLNEIADTTPEELRLPIKGGMFHSHRTGFPPPFLSPDLEWQHMKCRYCKARPFLKPDEILSTDGLYQISAEIVDRMPALEEMQRVTDEFLKNHPYPKQEVTVGDLLQKDSGGVCPICGKLELDFKNKAGFLNHVRFCEKKRNG